MSGSVSYGVPLLFACGILLRMSPALAQPPGEKTEILNQHNMYRCMHNVQLFEWDDAIAANAQAWADNGDWAHSPSTQRMINGEQLGENMAWGFPSQNGVEAATNWYSEIQFTEPYGTADSFDDSTDPNQAIGHYTQVVWASSTKLGCGKGRATISGNEGDFWVCQYGPAGNYQGQFTSNVNAPIREEGECTADSNTVGDDDDDDDDDDWNNGNIWTCRDVKTFYRDHDCCGMPDKMIPWIGDISAAAYFSDAPFPENVMQSCAQLSRFYGDIGCCGMPDKLIDVRISPNVLSPNENDNNF